MKVCKNHGSHNNALAMGIKIGPIKERVLIFDP